MKVLFKKKDTKNEDLERLVQTLKSDPDPNRFGSIFVELIEYIRPYKEQPALYLKQVIELIQKDKQLHRALQNMFYYLVNNRDSESIFTDVGILKSGTLASEAWAQFRHKILPPLADKRSLQYLLESAFHKRDDHKWVNAIPEDLWFNFFELLSAEEGKPYQGAQKHLKEALTVLSFRVTSLGFEDELKNIKRADEKLLTPFILQNKAIVAFVNLLSGTSVSEALIIETAEEAIQAINECNTLILEIRSSTQSYGTDLRQSYVLMRTSQQLMRMTILIRMLTPGIHKSRTLTYLVNFFQSAVTNLNKQYSLRSLFSKNTELLAYQITEHKSNSGEHYITTTRNQFIISFYAACAGGLIIGFIALFKALLAKLDMAPFWQYFWYSTNYAFGFVLLFVTGAILATKQPTMTASALASSLDKRKSSDLSFESFAITFGKVWRSQFASFAGNILITFPTAYLLAVAWFQLTGTKLFVDEGARLAVLEAQQPTKSLVWFYASITGVFLFLSGMITGYLDNKTIYARMGPRIKNHPTLRKFLKPNALNKVADYIVNNLGGITGNIALGFMLGYADLFGNFFGIPFDIRHITISTAYFGFAVEELGNMLSTYNWLWTAIGVLGVGFFNFLISFSIAFYVAIRSRGLSVKIVPAAAKAVWKYFIKYPLDFIYPPKESRKKTDLLGIKGEDKKQVVYE